MVQGWEIQYIMVYMLSARVHTFEVEGALSPNPGHYKKLKVDQKQNRMQVYAKKMYFT